MQLFPNIAIQYISMQCNTIQRNTAMQPFPIQYNTMPCTTVECNSLQCNINECITMCIKMRCCTLQSSSNSDQFPEVGLAFAGSSARRRIFIAIFVIHRRIFIAILHRGRCRTEYSSCPLLGLLNSR